MKRSPRAPGLALRACLASVRLRFRLRFRRRFRLRFRFRFRLGPPPLPPTLRVPYAFASGPAQQG